MRLEGQLVGDHARCWARHQTLSDPAHLAAAAQLRHDHAAALGRRADQAEVQLRRLADYDQAFGLDDGQGVA